MGHYSYIPVSLNSRFEEQIDHEKCSLETPLAKWGTCLPFNNCWFHNVGMADILPFAGVMETMFTNVIGLIKR